MSLFGNVKAEAADLALKAPSVIHPTGIMELKIVDAFLLDTANGGKNMHVNFEPVAGGRTINIRTFVVKADGTFSGWFKSMNELVLVVLGKSITELKDASKKSLKLFGKEELTQVEYIDELENKVVLAGVVHQKSDKTTAASNWQPTGETFEHNVIDVYFNLSTGKTAFEMQSTVEIAPESQYIHTWAKRNKGVLRDKTVKVAGKGTTLSGKPSAAAKSFNLDD